MNRNHVIAISSESNGAQTAIRPSDPLPVQTYFGDNTTGGVTLVSGANPMPVTVADDPNAVGQDGRGRERVVQPLTLWDGSFVEMSTAELALDYVSANADVSAGLAELDSQTATANSYLQTRKWMAPQQARSVVMAFSTVLDVGGASLLNRAGYFESNASNAPQNGVWIQAESGAVSFCYAVGGVVTAVAQASWNDPLDGIVVPTSPTITGSALSGRRQTFVIEVDWAGAGQISLYLVLDRRMIPLHRIAFGNVALTVPQWARNSLPLRIDSDYNVSGGVIRLFSWSLACDGQSTKIMRQEFSEKRVASHTAVPAAGGDPVPIFVLRPSEATTSRATIYPKAFQTSGYVRGNLVQYRVWRIVADDQSDMGSGTETGVLTSPVAFAAPQNSVGSQAQVINSLTTPALETTNLAAATRKLVGTFYGDGEVVQLPDDLYLAKGIAGDDTDCDLLIIDAVSLVGNQPETVACTVWWAESRE